MLPVIGAFALIGLCSIPFVAPTLFIASSIYMVEKEKRDAQRRPRKKSGYFYRNTPLAKGAKLNVIKQLDDDTLSCYMSVGDIKAAFPGSWPKAYNDAKDSDMKAIRVKLSK